ncbi:SDR family oxidoreductase [Steroidobacter flavus]|uniref:SDR family oxidoreductase n=1 Tax=Steroidobacter flavus TaxID=1842136 RepID=A0ABV8T0U0_9GAMM
MSRLQGKYALITGGTGGIGLEAARQFLSEGATVAITGRSTSGLEAAKQELGGRVLTIRSDAGDAAHQDSVATTLREHWPQLDALFVNAADMTHRSLADWDEAAFDALLATNLKGPFFLIRALLPFFANPASIVLCSSVAAHIGLPQSSVYAASKAGLLSLARTLSGELKSRGIRVNALTPGPTETSAFTKLGPEQDTLRAQIRKMVPAGRMGTPLELAKAAVFLASDESRFMLGGELLVDGGVSTL